MKKKIAALSVAAMALVGCGGEDVYNPNDLSNDFKIEQKMSWENLSLKNSNSKMSLYSGKVYVACIEQQSYMITTRDSSLDVLPIMDKDSYVYCKPKRNNEYYIVLENGKTKDFDNTGTVEFCVGGYKFFHMRVENGRSKLIQPFEPNGQAKFCLPKNIDFAISSKVPILHPNLKSKAEAIEKILKEKASSGTVDKIY